MAHNLFISEPKTYVSELSKFIRAGSFGVTLSDVNNQMMFDKSLPCWHSFGSETNIL